MNCAQARDRLSEFYDRQLPADDEGRVRAHVQQCSECARRLEELRRMSHLVAQLPDESPPPAIWTAIEDTLADRRPRRTLVAWWSGSRWKRATAAAAALLVLASAGVLAYRLGVSGHDDSHLAVHFTQYVDEFSSDPERAQNLLVASYEGRYVDPVEAARRVRFVPIAPANLPSGLARDRICVLKMPCCTCVQTILKDDAGRVVAVFEHIADEPAWFADRPGITAHCRATPTRIIQLNDSLAATWKRQSRFVTVVGARDLEEVSQLVACLGSGESPPAL